MRSSSRSISSTARKLDHTNETFHGRADLGSHSDTTIAGRNYTILPHTERSCDVVPFSYTYKPMKYVDIVLASTGFKSVTGQQYVLVFHEAFYMPELDHTLINTNQLRQLHTQVQYNTYHAIETMNITNPSGDFTGNLESQGTNIFLNAWFATQTDLAAFQHIELTPHQP